MVVTDHCPPFSEGAPLKKSRRKRSFNSDNAVEDLEKRATDDDIMESIEGVLPDDIVAICEGDLLKEHEYCSPDLGVVGSDNMCKIKSVQTQGEGGSSESEVVQISESER